MKLLISPSPKKLLRFLQNDDLRGKSFLHHTGNMFGIGCRVSDTEMIKRITKLKQRDDNDGYIALIPDIRWFDDENIPIPARLRQLLNQYWPGNLTVVFECEDPRFDAIRVRGKVAFRVPDDNLLRMFIEMLGEPIVSTSVNLVSLPPENDLLRLHSFYAPWFDFAVYPNPRQLPDEAQPSTIIEFYSSNQLGNPENVDKIKCIREGSIPWHGVAKSFELPTITFICTANICRSPIAEKLFNQKVKERGLKVVGDSCGLLPSGFMISLYSMQLLMERGIIEAQSHISKQITPEIVSQSWLLLTMEERQRDTIRQQEPAFSHKILTLNEIAGIPGDIEDPFGTEIEYYRETMVEIETCLDILLDRIEAGTIGQ